MADAKDQEIRNLKSRVKDLETQVAALLAAAISHGWTV